MALLAELPKVYPISDLRTRLSEIEEEARFTREPIILTRNGASSLVVMDSKAYDEHLRHERAVRKLREAEIEEKYRRESISYDDAKAHLDDLMNTLAALEAKD